MAAIKGAMKPGQGFQPGNHWGELKRGTKSRRVREWEFMGNKITGEMNTAYLNITERLLAGEEVTKNELEAMNRYEKLLEYFKPKLARQELVGDKDNPISINGISMIQPESPKNDK